MLAGMRKITIHLPERTEQRIRRAARQLGVSRAEITAVALEEYLEPERGPWPVPAGIFGEVR